VNDLVRVAVGALTDRNPGLRTALAAAVAVGVSLVATSTGAAEPPQITEKRAEARRVLAEIQSLDVELGSAIEAYNGASEQLAAIDRDRDVNAHRLRVAKDNLTVSQQRLGARLRAIYTSGAEDSTLAVLLGARSLGDFVSRIETINSVAAQDTQVLQEVIRFKRDVTRRATQLRWAHDRQSRVVAERAATKQRIEAGLAERRRLVASIKDEIVRLEAQERARQERLRIEVERRLAAQQAAQQRALEAAENQSVVGASAVTPDGTFSVAPPSQYTGVVAIAMQYLSVPYVWGGASPSGFDCSGLTMYVYAQVGVSLPHHAATQFNYGVPVSRDQLQPGDLVFFHGLGHMGMYIGNGQFIHAPHAGDVVKISSLSDSWYAATYVGARRIV
jgi:cell wall-associated NlpC family hydrolase